MHGHRESSRLPRVMTTLAHFAVVAGAAWYLITYGTVASRSWALIACAVVYVSRATFGMFVLLKRKFDFTEAGIVTGLFVTLHLTFAWLGAGSDAPWGWLDNVAIVMYLAGSYLNTGAEYGRHRWKRDPQNEGKLYTGGLFRYAMHINYFGDTLLFTGFAILTHSVWALLVPGVMTVGFVFQHVPNLDRYLAERYHDSFPAYARRTKKLVPFLY